MTVTENSLEHKTDQRHADILTRDLGIDESSKGVTPPGVRRIKGVHTPAGQAIGEKLFRAVAARGNYLGHVRMDIGMQFAVKEISRFMSKPEDQDWRSKKR